MTFSWLKNPVSGVPTHLGVAFHETADGAPGSGRGLRLARFDEYGRDIMHVRYFCIPYADLAARAVSYQQLYDTFRDHAMPAGHAPVTASLVGCRAAGGEQPAEVMLARETAAQLFTGQPVNILGAGAESLEQRIRFLDLVMQGLPYGARSQLSAATAVNSCTSTLNYRLFFSSAPRDETGQDAHVMWGHPNLARVTSGEAAEYLRCWGPGRRADLPALARDTRLADFRSSGAQATLARVQRTVRPLARAPSRFPGQGPELCP